MGVNDPAPKPNLQELFAPVDKTTNRITNRMFYSVNCRNNGLAFVVLGDTAAETAEPERRVVHRMCLGTEVSIGMSESQCLGRRRPAVPSY